MACCVLLSRLGPAASKAGRRRPKGAGYGRNGSNQDRCFWVAGKLRCPVPIPERENLAEDTARRAVGPERIGAGYNKGAMVPTGFRPGAFTHVGTSERSSQC